MSSNGPHLALIGMAGAGKSAVSRRVAQRLRWPHIDLDAMIVSTSGSTIPDIFAERGEPAFRDLEASCLADALARPCQVVIATGGGVVERSENRERLAAMSTVVWLDAPQAVLVHRLKASSVRRPLLADDIEANVARLMERRCQYYRELCDVRVDVGPLDLAAASAAVLDSAPVRALLGDEPDSTEQ